MARQGLGLDEKSSSFVFLTDGPLNRSLDVGGTSVQYGKTIVYDQDASIMGWTCGNADATSLDMARFYYNLLGPPCSFVSKESLDIMTTFRTLSEGWAKDYIDYGTGLMIQNMAPAQYVVFDVFDAKREIFIISHIDILCSSAKRENFYTSHIDISITLDEYHSYRSLIRHEHNSKINARTQVRKRKATDVESICKLCGSCRGHVWISLGQRVVSES